jgi:hypothetical protein
MKHNIEIRNGSGWNNYAGLKDLKNLPAGTKGLMKKNGVAEINIGPADDEKPFGVAARYYDADGEMIWEQSFGEDSSASWIRGRITSLLEETISVRREQVRAERAAEALKKANAAGFATANEHSDHLAAMKAKAAAERDIRWAWLKGDNGGKEAAAAAVEKMRELRKACPQADGMTRGGKLGKLINSDSPFGGWAEVFESHVLDNETRRNGMLAWLLQNGHRAGLDDRHFFFAAAE